MSENKHPQAAQPWPNWNEHLRRHNALQWEHDFDLFKVVEDYVNQCIAQAAQPVGVPDIQTIRGAVDRAWRSPNNAIKVIAPGLAEAIAQEMHAMLAAAQPAQPSADAARLDWIEAHPRLSTIVVNGQSRDCYFYGVAGASGLKLREIIDAARAAESGQ